MVISIEISEEKSTKTKHGTDQVLHAVSAAGVDLMLCTSGGSLIYFESSSNLGWGEAFAYGIVFR